MSQATIVSAFGVQVRTTAGYDLPYGFAAGGLAGVLFGAVDGVAMGFTGSGIPWVLPPMIIASYLVLGYVGGGLLAVITGLLAVPNRPFEGSGQARADIRFACLAGCVAAVVTVLFERLQHGHETGFGQELSSVSIAMGVVVAAGVMVLATRFLNLRHSPLGFAWPVICVALFCVAWKPVNDLYQAPILSMTSVLANTVCMAAAAGTYFAGRRVARHVLPLVRVDTSLQCVLSTIAIGLVGCGVAEGALWCVRQKPIDIPYRPSPVAVLPATRQMPNVVLIVMDTTRADHLSIYGYQRNTTPNLAVFATEGVLYTRAIASSSWTLPSHASLFTGLLPTEHAAHFHFSASGDDGGEVRGLADEYTTLAEVLLAHGYNTGAVIGNTAVVTRDLGLSQGFLYFDDRERFRLASAEPRTLSPALWMTRFYQKHAEEAKRFKAGGWQFRYFWRYADELNAAVFGWLNRERKEPFFLFINYMDPHDPYRPHPEFDERLYNEFDPAAGANTPAKLRRSPQAGSGVPVQREEIANYDAEIAFVDQQIGLLFDKLKTDGTYDQTLIIVLADHGEAFGEHGLFGHNNTLYQEEIHVPLIIRYPGGAVRGVNDEITSLASVMPTILAYLGIDNETQVIESGESLQCRTLAELRCGDQLGGERQTEWIMRALFTPQGVKVITPVTPYGGVEIYDLDRDPYEAENLSVRRKNLAERAGDWLHTWAAEAQTRRPKIGESPRMSDEVRRKLSALGYLD